jgi:hypothetical protein
MKKTLRTAALALGGVLTLLMPVTAAARDRGGERGGFDRGGDRGRTEQHFDRGRDFRGPAWGGPRIGVAIGVGAPGAYVCTPGYYDQFGYWHPPVYCYQ